MKSHEMPGELFEALKPVRSSFSSKEKSPTESPTAMKSEKSEIQKRAELAELQSIIGEIENKRDELKNAMDSGDKTIEIAKIAGLNIVLMKARSIRRKIEGEDTSRMISTEFTYKDEKGKEVKKSIELDIERQVESFVEFYKKYEVELPTDFSEIIMDIWDRNIDEIQKSIEEKGFDAVLLIPESMPTLAEINAKMTDGYTETWLSDNFKDGGSFDGVSISETGTMIVLVHSDQNMIDNPVLKRTLGKKAEEFIRSGETLTLADYLLLQRKIFDETGQHIDTKKDGVYYWTWLPGSTVPNPSGGVRVVSANWSPDDGGLSVLAVDPGVSVSYLGCRLSRCFK